MKKSITILTIVLVVMLVVALCACDLFGKKPSTDNGGNTNTNTGDAGNTTPGGNGGNTEPADTTHETKTINFTNGKYEGQVLTGTNTFDGQGTLVEASGDRYVGAWVNGKRQGQGTQYYVSGDVYTGAWLANQFHGKGKYTWSDGDYYDGDWVMDAKTGKGTFLFNTGNVATYVGDVVSEVLTGKATITYRNGNVYEGDVRDGQRNGQGTLTYAEDQTTYVGGWSVDKENGQGTRTIKTAAGIDTLTGAWENGKIANVGTYVYQWANGERYEGAFASGKPAGQGEKRFLAKDGTGAVIKDEEGNSLFDVFTGLFAAGAIANQTEGIYTWYNGDRYAGAFVNGVPNGQGILAYANGDRYVGQFAAGVLSGAGTFTWASGDVYTGAFSGGLPNGEGTKTFVKADGNDTFTGLFAAGEIADQTSGSYTWANGDGYTGAFASGLPAGQGTKRYVAKDGQGNALVDGQGHLLYDVFTGTFVAGEAGNQGKMVWHDGYVYDGNWSGGKKDGTGVYYDTQGQVYVGTWAMDVKDGQGTLAKRVEGTEDYAIVYAADWSDDDYDVIFAGTWRADAKANGVYFYTADGEDYKYDGAFNADEKKQGQGTLYRYNAGTRDYTDQLFTGTWNNDLYYTGTGVYVTADAEFNGQFVNGKISNGTLLYTSNGRDYKYVGAFNADGEKDGAGDLYVFNVGTQDYDDVFKGTWLANAAYTGHGRIDYASGDYYIGGLAEGKRSGLGDYYYANEDTYSGAWENDNKHGQGTYTFKDGNKYIGNWANNVKSGSGRLVYADGSTFEGTFANDESVNGKYTYTADDVKYQYDGDFSDGMKNGNGKLYLYNDATQQYDVLRYDGDWTDDQRNGTGTYYYEDGARYFGLWLADKRDTSGASDGVGVYFYTDGNVYTGRWLDDAKAGEGVLSYKQEGETGYRVIYTGNWAADKKSGEGTYYYDDGEYYAGNWAEDRMTMGAYYYASGDVYEGAFNAAGKKNDDNATYTWADGRVFQGKYVDGEMTNGIYTYVEADVTYQYVGDFASGKKHGQGVWSRHDGEKYVKVYEGEWSNDVINGTGTYYGANDRYVGAWVNGLRQGVGVEYYYEDSIVYLGNWAGDEKSGKGIQAQRVSGEEAYDLVYAADWANADFSIIYSGDWVGGKYEGEGVYYYSSENKQYKYVGEFADGNMDGEGKLYEVNGSEEKLVFDGTYSGGAYVSGTYVYVNDKGIECTYVGSFNAMGQMHGANGVLTYTENDTDYKFEGTFANGQPVDAEGTYYRREGDNWVALS